MQGSYRQILRSSSIIGGASVINILIGLLRMKAAAVLLGPAGVGLVGLFTNLVGAAKTVAGVGVGAVGTRQIAEAAGRDDAQRILVVRRALFWLTLGLAAGGGGAFWLLRGVLAASVLDEPALASDLGWLSIAVALSIAAASQNALLNGMRRIGDIARVSVGSALLSTVLALLTLWQFGRGGIVFFVIAAPLASFLLGHWYVARLPSMTGGNRVLLSEMSDQWRSMLHLGMAFMVAGLAATIGQLLVRTIVQQELGANALGHFQAAWGISMTYIGFVLAAMGTDYYPRLTAVIQDHSSVNRLVNEQAEVALLLAAPVLLATLALAPWVIRLLYSSQFGEAVEVLRWQVLGDILKVASWPLGFILLAAGAGKAFIMSEWLSSAIFVLLTAILVPGLGIVATGVAFLGMYVVCFSVVYALAVRKTGFAWEPAVKRLIVATLLAGLGIIGLARFTAASAALVGTLAAAGFGAHALVRLSHASGLTGPVAQLADATKSALIKLGAWRE